MIVRMFQPRFAPLVESGKKRQTIRQTPKRMPKVGDDLSLRCWVGKPYRSKQRELMRTKVKSVEVIEIHEFELYLDGIKLCYPDLEVFAVADGFNDFEDMIDWFSETHCLPFKGILISWESSQRF